MPLRTMVSNAHSNMAAQQPSRLLALPTELRLCIYEFAVATHGYILDIEERTSDPQLQRTSAPKQCLRLRGPNTSPLSFAPYLLACKQMYKEAFFIVYNRKNFLVDSPSPWFEHTLQRSSATDKLPHGTLAFELNLAGVADPDAAASEAARHLLKIKSNVVFDLTGTNALDYVDDSAVRMRLRQGLMLEAVTAAGLTDVGLTWCRYWEDGSEKYDGLKELLRDPEEGWIHQWARDRNQN